ncbi:hypothetical protein [Catenuloplanes atrovinosus]|uniref:Uncharacterized protein n=1 Tax=Catenuloplanes atrovinosus TaxID=137266 RepID=A0AAE3YLV9_9ACTN|nr:hypothetical protein [Catenuloplanes atrovinosus]MDR7275392.1 hypothetical protein [Catenuloplanes atrovinosus]
MKTRVLAGTVHDLPIEARALIAGTVTALCGMLAGALLLSAYLFPGLHGPARQAAELTAALTLLAAAPIVWFRVLPRLRWLGLPAVALLPAVFALYLGVRL